MDDKTKHLLETLVSELGDQSMSAVADATINEGFGRMKVGAACRKYADERRAYADAVKAAVEENGKLLKALRWALNELPDARQTDETPAHVCDYDVHPDWGHCEFHVRYWEARELAFPEEFNGEEETA